MTNVNANKQTSVQLLTEREAAKFLRVSPRTVFGLREAGKLVCVKIGRSVRYRLAELERFICESEKEEAC